MKPHEIIPQRTDQAAQSTENAASNRKIIILKRTNNVLTSRMRGKALNGRDFKVM